MILSVYRALTTLGHPLIRLYLLRRLALGKENRERFGERLGRPGRPRPDGKLIWIHAASVGESMSLLPLIERLRAERPQYSVLLTTGTVTSARLMDNRLPGGAVHQFVPVDMDACCRRFLNHWRPDLVLWAESEFWPNLISRAAAMGLPMVLLNGRVSNKSYRAWRRFPGLIGKLLAAFSLCLGQTEADAARLSRLGAGNAKSAGNLKSAAPPLPADRQTLDRLAARIGDRPRWLASSTHNGEEEIAGRVHQSLKEKHPGLLTIVVPRHPGRGPEVARSLRATGLNVALRSANQDIDAGCDIYVADTMGELGLFYRLAPIVFMGKSLSSSGGQNPLEPARLGCAVIIGPHMSNFENIVATLKGENAVIQVADEAALGLAVGGLLEDPERGQRLARAAMGAAKREAGVLDTVMKELEPFLREGR